MEFKHILIPVDFSDFSNKALEFGLELAQRFNSEITLFHAVVLFQDDVDEESRVQEFEEYIKKREQQINTQMKDNQSQAQGRGIKTQTVIERGISAADSILEYLESHPVDLVVMGTHGRSGLKHFLQGSVAEKVVRLAPVPVLTVHRSVKHFNLKRILVPIDFSSYSKAATDYAIFFAEKTNASLDFLHVIEQEIHPSIYAAGIESIFEIDSNLKERVIQHMKEFLQDQLTDHLKVDYHVREGKAHKEIVEFVKEHDIDLIVIATHGLTGLDYLLLGSTTEKVVRWATCPVLTVKLSRTET